MKKIDWKFFERIEREGVQAEARIFGVLRGGHAYQGSFHAFVGGLGLISAKLGEVTELRATGVRALSEVRS